ncbi:MAG TPA: DUF4382 domain-containing protein [Candidatus Thermoplasmatota archaeon]|nr:DUF4382 domain-containing protein [Candidatus Thermoplasmatota archaeon]
MRVLLTTAVCLGLLAGCLGSGGRLTLRLTDAPDAIGDFAALPVTISQILVTKKGSEGETGPEASARTELTPGTASYDLTALVGNATTLFSGTLEPGTYGRIDLLIGNEIEGTLRDGATVDVGVPSGRVFLLQEFTIEEGAETDFLFDVDVHREGDGDYILKPNASGSGPGKQAPAEG